MPRFLVSTRRDAVKAVPSALAAVGKEGAIKIVNSSDPNMITIETSHERAQELRKRLSDTHYVEPEMVRGLD